MFAKDGYSIIFGSFIIFSASWGVWYLSPHIVSFIATVLLGVFSIFNLFFFRDPQRIIPDDVLAIISPADGKIMQIVNILEPDYFNMEVQRISIFLSVFNVHVNRTPIAGKVDFVAYRTGRFLAAFKKKASLENEQTIIGLVDKYGHRVMFKQIAGAIARRIICHLKEGEWRKAGERMGLIRYGSRVDVFIPNEAKIQVHIGQMVKGGQSILATFPNIGGVITAEQDILKTSPKQVPF